MVSLVIWGIGLIPDFGMIRDRVIKPWQKKFYGLLSFGWGGSARHWSRFEEVSLVLAGLSTPLVFSVHSIVSFDFATSVYLAGILLFSRPTLFLVQYFQVLPWYLL